MKAVLSFKKVQSLDAGSAMRNSVCTWCFCSISLKLLISLIWAIIMTLFLLKNGRTHIKKIIVQTFIL